MTAFAKGGKLSIPPFWRKAPAVILTGGLANSTYLCDLIKERVSWISEVICVPGEDELRALAEGAYKVLTGEEEAHIYEKE